MQDAITNVINKSDVQGCTWTRLHDRLEQYFASGELRVRAAATISANASAIIKDAVAKALLYSDITRPGGNMYTTRRYAACIRDLDYYLRYSTYAMLAGDTSILDERVLNGLKETYNSLGVPIGATVQSIQAMKEVTASLVGPDAGRKWVSTSTTSALASATEDPHAPLQNHRLHPLPEKVRSQRELQNTFFTKWVPYESWFAEQQRIHEARGPHHQS
jgi:allophycocyanin beta subunit